MPHIDLYAIYGLDRRQPPEALAAQLTAQFNATDPQDALTRSRIDTARAILGDPQRRARYEAQLADPNAPALDEAALATIAGRPVPTQARSGLAAAFAETKVKILAAVVGVLALILVVAVTAVACSGDGSTPTASDGSSQSSAQSSGGSECEVENNSKIDLAYWKKTRKSTPSRLVVLEKKIDIPGQHGFGNSMTSGQYYMLNDSFRVNFRGMTQLQDKSIAVFQGPETDDVRTGFATVTTVSPEGEVVSTRNYGFSQSTEMPAGFDLAKNTTSGYFRIVGTDGAPVPAGAAGTEENQAYARQILPDAFEDSTVWVVMQGEDRAIYKAKLYHASDDAKCPN